MKSKVTKKVFNPFKVLKKNHTLKTFVSVLLSIAIINLSNSCSYYKVKDLTTSSEDIEIKINNFNQMGYYAIVHSGNNTFHLDEIKIDQENNVLTGVVDSLSSKHVYKKARRENRTNRFKTNKQDPVSEIHINLKKAADTSIGSDVTIPLEDIYSVSLNKRDGLAEFAVFMLGLAGVLFATVLIILATKSSCPFVYVKTGNTYQFIGELYPGVLTENMQRDDFIPLGRYNEPKQAYSIMVTNELKEIQYTDFLELIVVDHPESVEVLMDDTGNLYTFSNLQQPHNVVIDDVKQDMKILNTKDGMSYAFNNISEWDDNKRHATIEFDTPNTTSDAKLYLTAKNSMWLDYIFGKFNEQFGSYYKEFQAQQQTKTKSQSEKWIDEQHIPLSVYIETMDGWELVKTINTVGPLAYRDLVVPIDSKYIQKDKLRVKLESGFMFWEVDYVGIDFSDNVPLNVTYISPDEAIDQNNQMVTKLLSKEDNVYLTQSKIGDKVTVNFNLNNVSETGSYSVFLKNRGYYNYIREYKGEPNLESLKVFRKAGSFTDFSKLEYYAIMDVQNRDNIALKE
jgi:hypothetical protein